MHEQLKWLEVVASLPHQQSYDFRMSSMPDLAHILKLYTMGLFPMGNNDECGDLISWVCPSERAIFPLHELRISRSLARTIRRQRFVVTIDQYFRQVVSGCAERPKTWLNPQIRRAFTELFDAGHAHSVEVHRGEDLVGGLYGLAIGGAFFGESMFSRERDASKVGLVYLVARLRHGGFSLLDAQIDNDHLRTLGSQEVTRRKFSRLLAKAVQCPADFYRMPAGLDADRVLQLATVGD